ncbi:uncharacterized protein TNCV_3339671 [Trichonephila clavipes]|nr:uncharacterized protein TNCV_3339671 [Trichonephila clavipes]
MVHRLTGISQYAIGQISLYPTNGLAAKSLPIKPCTAWPPRPPDLMLCYFYQWGSIKDCVYVPPLPADLSDLRHIIEAAVARISSDSLKKACDELVYRLDLCPVTNGAHIEHL